MAKYQVPEFPRPLSNALDVITLLTDPDAMEEARAYLAELRQCYDGMIAARDEILQGKDAETVVAEAETMRQNIMAKVREAKAEQEEERAAFERWRDEEKAKLDRSRAQLKARTDAAEKKITERQEQIDSDMSVARDRLQQADGRLKEADDRLAQIKEREDRVQALVERFRAAGISVEE